MLGCPYRKGELRNLIGKKQKLAIHILAACAALVGFAAPASAVPTPSITQGGTPPSGWGVGHAQLTVFTYKQIDTWDISLRVQNSDAQSGGWLTLGEEYTNFMHGDANWPGITAPDGYQIIDCPHAFSWGWFAADAVVYAQYKFHWSSMDDNNMGIMGDIYPAVFSYRQPAQGP